jgi:EAL domain-containing protein (putative c-di-GMP-specific phosphodiesterase class I)
MGGDEFGITLAAVAHSKDIILIVQKLMKTISQNIKAGKEEIVITPSIGISIYPNDGTDVQTLIQNADIALSNAQEQGGNNYQFYTQGMNKKASELILMERQLINALKNDEFILHYQPYWDINTKKITGMEALIRWQSSDKGLVPPGKFIPILEETKMIIEVGEWILRTAVRQIREWQNKGYPVVPVSVNLSLIQFRQKDLAEMVKKVIEEYGLNTSLLTLEITESAFMQDIDFTRSVLKTLKDIGTSISIDDFGTGYSSLSYLKRFPVDNLKIDISFIREIATDPDTASIVTAIIGMAHTLNIKTIAEGVETEEQWKILRLLRCDVIQGFYLSKPLPAEEIEKIFRK